MLMQKNAFLIRWLLGHTWKSFTLVSQVKSGTKMGLMFEVAEGGFLDIDVRIVGPDGKTIHQVKCRQFHMMKYFGAVWHNAVYISHFREKGSPMENTHLLLTWTASTSTASPTRCPPWPPRLSCSAWTSARPPVTQPRMKRGEKRWGSSTSVFFLIKSKTLFSPRHPTTS